MAIPFADPLKKAEEWLYGRPQTVSVWILLGIAAVCVTVAIWGHPGAKSAAAVWFLLP